MTENEVQILLSCEHGGNKIPARYTRLFAKGTKALSSHRGWDPGALSIAKGLSRTLNAPLQFSETSRLLIELNRSLHHVRLFSEFTEHLDDNEKKAIIDDHYLPYRNGFEKKVRSSISKKQIVLHFSIHSFTPELNGETRNCEVGLLYDPRRKLESSVAARLRCSLREIMPDLRVRMNYPYQGRADGFTTHLRKSTSSKSYSGIEIELNQALLARIEKHGTKTAFSRNLAWAINESIFQGEK